MPHSTRVTFALRHGTTRSSALLPNSSMAEAPYTAQAALTEPAGAMQMSTMDAAMHSGRVAR